MEKSTTEVVGYGGFQHFPGAAKGQVGGAIGRVPDGNSVVFAETSYAPLGFGENVLNFGGGFNFGFRTRIDNLVPYILVFGGLGRDMVSGGGSSNYVLFGAGFGAHFLGSNWGVRPEFRWQRYQHSGDGANTFVFVAGLFYRFGRR